MLVKQRTYFQMYWLNDDEFSPWILQGKSKTQVAWCKFCPLKEIEEPNLDISKKSLNCFRK